LEQASFELGEVQGNNMSQQTSRAIRSRVNYTGLTCLLLAAVGYVGVHSQSTVSTGQPASTISTSPDVNQAVLTVTSASHTAANTPDPANTSAASDVSAKPVVEESTSSDDNSNLQVTVNGQSIEVPANGSVNQSVPNETGDGQTNISISNSQSSSGASTGYSFTSTHSNESSSSSSVNFSSEHNSP
jgi:hypothetical protein